MSTTFQSCPGCDSFILSDTASCPQCGHVFDQDRAAAIDSAAQAQDMKNQQMYNTCRSCGEEVRAGLVRCWNCNTFVRSDVENRYKEMQSTPQPIIFSESESRSEYLTPEEREQAAKRVSVFDAMDEGEFTLRASLKQTEAEADDGFELSESAGQQSAAAPAEPPTQSVPAQPGTPEPKDAGAKDQAAEKSNGEAKKEEKRTNGASRPDELDDDDFVGIALQDERESRRRKRDKIDQARKRRILLPCGACGSWIRVRQDQSGRTVRCRQCKAPLLVPTMKAKKKSKAGAKKAAPAIQVRWIDDVRMHVVAPTNVTLKPGSLVKAAEPVDIGIHESGIHIVKFTAPKKGLFGKSTDGPPAVEDQRKLTRDHVLKTGKLSALPHGELKTIGADAVSSVRLVQPVAEAHESMFAGVPVFGEGRIAVYLPLSLEDNKQAFLSLSLTNYRQVSAALKSQFETDLGAEANGVPAKETFDVNTCFLSEVKIEGLQELVYYENDPEFELEVSGYVCATCGIAITEEARARKKLGGAAGKGIAKAKCPKCSSKFGNQKAFRIARSPETSESAEEDDPGSVKDKDAGNSPKGSEPKSNAGADAKPSKEAPTEAVVEASSPND